MMGQEQARQLIFATNNKHKLEEIQAVVGDRLRIVGLEELGYHEEIPETATTLEGNALLKARQIFATYGQPCFADDTGLEVEALDGRPGVYSARYAGPACLPKDNMQKLLAELIHTPAPRKARFRTVIALIDETGEHLFEGSVQGEILTEERGDGGFGYDPLFLPQGEERTFAEMSASEKNKLSHRARAMAQLTHYLLCQG